MTFQLTILDAPEFHHSSSSSLEDACIAHIVPFCLRPYCRAHLMANIPSDTTCLHLNDLILLC